MVHDPAQLSLFPRLPIERIREMCEDGEVLDFSDGEAIFNEGETNYPFFVVLEGRVRVTKKHAGEEVLLVVHEPGQFTGEISILTGGPALATGRAEGATRVLKYANDKFRHLIAECPQVAEPVLTAFAARSREVNASIVQQEKLVSLGKMAASLAHELNNPAAAMVRTAQALKAAISRVSELGMKYDCRFDSAERPVLEELQKEVRKSASDPETLSPLERSDREEALAQWLEESGVEGAWDMAPGLVHAGVTVECVGELNGRLKPETLAAALTWVEADLTTGQLAKEIESASCRISDLVLAMKQYTYMDQAQFQDIDVHAGLDSTLKIFSHRTRSGVEVRREYDRSIPKIPAYAGELNQVWTNLISNALDAMSGSGTLIVSTRRDAGDVVVTIADTGPGIPPEILSRIFEPFVTSKPAGQGTGLGLETARRVVVNRHGGKITVQSRPGETKFEVRLPIGRQKS